MILEKLNNQTNFTETEKIIANYLLDSNNSILGMTSARLGEVTYTSQAAVVRFYKKLGVDKFRTFYALLLEELAERKHLHEIDCRVPIKTNMKAEDVISTMTSYYVNEIYDTKLFMDKNMLQRLYNHLNFAKSVEIYGMGSATFIVKQLTNKISAFGLQCQSIESLKEFRLRFSPSKDKVAIIISLDEDDSTVKTLAEELNKDNVYTFGILGHNDEELQNCCKEYIRVNHGANEQNISTLCSALYVVDVIYSMFLSHYYK